VEPHSAEDTPRYSALSLSRTKYLDRSLVLNQFGSCPTWCGARSMHPHISAGRNNANQLFLFLFLYSDRSRVAPTWAHSLGCNYALLVCCEQKATSLIPWRQLSYIQGTDARLSNTSAFSFCLTQKGGTFVLSPPRHQTATHFGYLQNGAS
jgi:hypothetical protein